MISVGLWNIFAQLFYQHQVHLFFAQLGCFSCELYQVKEGYLGYVWTLAMKSRCDQHFKWLIFLSCTVKIMSKNENKIFADRNYSPRWIKNKSKTTQSEESFWVDKNIAAIDWPDNLTIDWKRLGQFSEWDRPVHL